MSAFLIGKARAARMEDGSTAIIYLSMGGSVELETKKLSGDAVKVHWFNPRQNSAQLIGTL